VTIIKGVLISTPGETFTVQFFRNPLSDPYEGKTFIRQLTSVQTDADGFAGFRVKVRRKVAPVLSAITATATRYATGDTSEFSAPKSVG
jgi:hypothetical protein